MHANSPPSQTDEAFYNELRKPSVAKGAKFPKLLPNAEFRAQNQLTGLPQELEEYLTTTDRPHESFDSLQKSRDGRFRLLLQRFTNQIQYGCKNPSCDVKTCMSYRKRHATTPIRPYTDVAARALAWRCVEQYADAGKSSNQNITGITKGRSKIHVGSSRNVTGLCWNEPVVPWYDDPTQAVYRNKISVHKESLTKNATADERPAKRYPDAVLCNGQPKGPTRAIVAKQPGVTTTCQDSKVAILRDEVNSISATDDKSEQIHSTSNHLGSRGKKPETTTSRDSHICFADLSGNEILGDDPKPKDTASFTQTIYDTLSVKFLDKTSASLQSPPDFVVDEPGIRKEVKQKAGGTEKVTLNGKAIHPTRSTSWIPRVASFKVLPLSAILWLRSMMPYDVNRSPHRDLSTTAEYGEYSMFARQSLHYCLSRPSILLDSAKTWTFVHHQPHKLDERTRKWTVKQLALREKSLLRATKKSELPQTGGIMVAIGMLIAITSIPEVLNHLFASLQHAYILPGWLQRVQTREGISSKSERATGIYGPPPSPKDSRLNEHQWSVNDPELRLPESVFLEDERVAQLCMLIVSALSLVLALKPQSFTLTHSTPFKDSFGEQYSLVRKSGVTFPHASLFKAWSKEIDTRPHYQAYTARIDTMDDWSFQRLLDSLADVISHRLSITESKKTYDQAVSEGKSTKNVVDMFVTEVFKASKKPDAVIPKQSLLLNLIDLLRSVILRRWDRKAILRRQSPAGGALELLAAIYRNRVDLEIPPREFEWAFVADAFDEIEMPIKWLDFRESSTQTHILSYSFLFEPSNLVTYFRAINSIMMKKSHEAASSVFTDARQFLHTMPWTIYGAKEVLSEIRPNMARFLVLTIHRDNMLQDAINQLWRRQRQELMRPLKVRLGKDEGEDGLDHGGVQAEFFRIIFAEALNPDFGMFTLDERTRMAWFQPSSLEPLYKFEALGILMSLAVYNGITLPITFPLAFYRKLLGLKVKKLQHITDGWSDLARGLQHLLDWENGDVGEDIARTYEFSYEAFGGSYSVDMSRVQRDDTWPPIERGKSAEKFRALSSHAIPSAFIVDCDEQGLSGASNRCPEVLPLRTSAASTTSYPTSSTPSASIPEDMFVNDEAPLVTNANRKRYVKDYIYWLTNKSVSPQFSSFAAGFYTCLDRTALSIFTPEHLKTVIEGHQVIDIDGLQATTTYDDYKPTDELIEWFWQVIRDMSPEQHKKLLEFVTASDRVPVNGINSVTFIVQRNGDGDERLPSSSTCYGRLLLPRYTTKEVLRQKLEKAIENSIGFGSL